MSNPELSTRKRCTGHRKDGAPCNGWAGASGLCLSHDPARAGQLAAARANGGRARHGRRIGQTGAGQAVTLLTLADALALLQETANDLRQLENSIQRGRALTALAATWGGLYEASELENRVAALEARLAQP
jgi:hypothetical protein